MLRDSHRGAVSKLTLLAAAAVLSVLQGCSQDPNVTKQKHFSSGEEFFKAGKYQEAAAEFRNAVQADPKFAAARYQLARAYLNLQNQDAAFTELKEAVALDPGNTDAQVEWASLLIARRDFDNAQAVLEKVLEANPSHARAHAMLGQKHAAMRDVPNAILEFRKAIELEPARVEYASALGAICLADGRTSEAEAVFKQAVRMNPKSVAARVDLIQFYLSQRNLAQAETEARAAADADPQAVLPRLLQAEILVRMGKTGEAETLARRLKTIAPDDPQAYQALGHHYVSTGQKEKAVAEFEALLATHPKDLSVKQTLVEILLDLDRIPQAASLNQEILKANSGDPRALLAQGRMLLTDRRYQEALTALQAAVVLQPDSAQGHYLLGVAQKAAGLVQQARNSFTRAAELDPRRTEAKVALATLARESGDPDSVLRLAGDVPGTDPHSPLALVVSAQALLAKGNMREAEAKLKAALDRDPTSVQALAALLKIYVAQGKAQDMVRRLAGLVQENPRNPGLHLLLALGHFSVNDLEKSQASLSRAMELDPKMPEAHTLRANLHFARGASEEGKQALRAAIAANPGSATNYLALSAQYEREGNWKEARKLCEKAREIAPSSPAVAAQLAYLHLEHGGDANVALSLALEASQRMSDSPDAAGLVGWAYYKAGRMDAAVAQLRRCADATPSNPTCHYHLGMALAATGDTQGARRSLETALKSPTFRYAIPARAALNGLAQ